MCGIIGWLVNSDNFSPDEKLFTKMRDTMIHRGPDGGANWFSKNRRVALGHRRLSIIDVSSTANMPMCNEDGTIWITFNGEIYNHAEIRPILEAKGHKFKTDHSDTEVMIHAFEEWGIDCVHKFRGMFAFAIWNDKKKELFLVRDRIGIKPLYYYLDGNNLIFASEIKAILASNIVSRSMHPEAFYHYLSFLTTPGTQTLFNNIHKLAPGSYALFKENKLQVKKYWDVLDFAKPLKITSEDEISEMLLAELKTAVRYRKVSDVPVGVFLSGGIDSSTNTALFSEGEAKPVKTFAIGYDQDYGTYKNELYYAQMMADFVKADHHELKLNINDLINFLPKLIFHQDEPIADPVCIPVYYVSKLARDNKVIVCQVGEGSDELFCGYPSWKKFFNIQRAGNIPGTYLFKKIASSYLEYKNCQQTVHYEWLRRNMLHQPIFWGGAEAFFETEKRELLSDEMNKKFGDLTSYEAIRPIYENFKNKAQEPSILNWMTYLDLNLRLPELLLMRVDKMSMATSIETRVPFLDHKFVELAFAIPEKIKFKNHQLKYILKKAVRNTIPQEIIDRKKQGFGVPIYEWFFDKLGDFTYKKIMAFTKRTNYFNPQYIEILLKQKDGVKLWYLLNFVLWHEKWIENKK